MPFLATRLSGGEAKPSKTTQASECPGSEGTETTVKAGAEVEDEAAATTFSAVDVVHASHGAVVQLQNTLMSMLAIKE